MEKQLERESKICAYMQSAEYIPLKPEEMAQKLAVPPEDIAVFEEMLERLVDDGRLEFSRKGRLLPAKMPIIGTLISMPKGNCLLTYEGGELFIPAENLNGAYPKDTVRATKTLEATKDKRAVGVVTKVIERGIRQIVAVYSKKAKISMAFPDDKRIQMSILIPKEKRNGAVTGQKVLVEIESFKGAMPKGRVLRILGDEGDPATEERAILIKNELPTEFPAEVLAAQKEIPEAVQENEWTGRKDFRTLPMVTIDGEDTKDFDDAVTISRQGDVFTLGVHIADASHYVREGSAIDKEALRRGNSVYLPDLVIPMLPFRLSNGICSLVEGQDRLALSCMMQIDAAGDVLSHEITESVIRIDRRLTYGKVSDFLAGEGISDYEPYGEMLRLMSELAEILTKRRRSSGALNFDMPESRIEIGAEGQVTDVCAYERNVATKIIEEFMVLCNETVAEQFFWSETPFIYRTHDAPDMEKIEELSLFLRNFGKVLKGRKNINIHPKAIQKILEDIEGTAEERIVSRSVLRTMKQARYSGENKGHFGLSLKYYCHFTSPIRRYADLEIHRIIKEALHGGFTEEQAMRLREKTEKIATHVSKTERTADVVEREVQRLKKAEYMADKIGEEFDGVISSVTKHGIYVELENTVEGMVALYSMADDYYVFEDAQMQLIGEATGKVYKLGDRVRIRVKNVSVKDRLIDFIFI